MAGPALLVAAGLSVVLLLLLLGLALYLLWRKKKEKKEKKEKEGRSQYEELPPSMPAGSAPLTLVPQTSWAAPGEVPFSLPPRFTTHKERTLDHGDGIKMEAREDAPAHRGSLSVGRWFPVGTVMAGLYSDPPLKEVVAPPPGVATRLCFSVEYRRSSEQLTVSLLRLSNLPPCCHGNVTLVELRLLPDDRRPRQAKARGPGPDPEFKDLIVFQVSAARVPRSTLSVCVLSSEQGGKRRSVGRTLLPMEGELGQAGRVLWRELEPEDDTQRSDRGEVQISLCYSPALQRLSVVVLRARGLQPPADAGVCVQVSLQIRAQAVKVKRSGVVSGGGEPCFSHRMTFRLRPRRLDRACLRFELLQPGGVGSEHPATLGVLVLGPFMYARGPQLQHWTDMLSTPQDAVKRWHVLGRPS